MEDKTTDFEINSDWFNVTMEELLVLEVDNSDDDAVECCPCGEYLSDEDIATIIAAENGPWTGMTVEEAIAHNRKLCGRDNGENDEIK